MNDMGFMRVKVFRFDPTKDQNPYYETYEIPYEKDMRVLDALVSIREIHDCNLAFRHSCRRRRCGMCGMLVNGKAVLACHEAAFSDMVVEPLPKLPVIRDLIVDTKSYEQKINELRPYLERKKAETEPELIKPYDMLPLRQLQTCIECYLCMSVCPVLELGWPGFAGPSALVQMARRALDPRDLLERTAERTDNNFVDCVSCYSCVNVCPVKINVLEDAVEPLKAQRQKKVIGRWARFNSVFVELVRDRALVNPTVWMLKAFSIPVLFNNIFVGVRFLMKGKISLKSKNVPNIEDIKKIYKATEVKK